MSIAEELWPEYKRARKTYPNIPARQAYLGARSELVRRCRNQLMPPDDPRQPDMVRYAYEGAAVHFDYCGVAMCLTIEVDTDAYSDDDMKGYTVSRNVNPYREPGWGHDGMDRGLYVADSTTLVTFEDTRLDIIKWTPKGMSKQVAYEEATDSLRYRAQDFKKAETSYWSVTITANGDPGDSLHGIEIAHNDNKSWEYLIDVVEEVYNEAIAGIDAQKKQA